MTVIRASLARRGITATPIDGVTGPLDLWLLTRWRPLDPDTLAMLSVQEQARAARFRSGALRDRYRAAHAALRCIVEHRFGIPAAAQRYAAGGSGKPVLIGHPNCHMNMSYSGNRVLIGVGGAALGVDIEMLRQVEDASALAALHYTAGERSLLDQVEPGSAAFDRLFLSVWTRKEACIKAAGRGIAELNLSRLECGASGPKAVRIDESQLRTGTITDKHDLLISWAWNDDRPDRRQAAESSACGSPLSSPSRMT